MTGVLSCSLPIYNTHTHTHTTRHTITLLPPRASHVHKVSVTKLQPHKLNSHTVPPLQPEEGLYTLLMVIPEEPDDFRQCIIQPTRCGHNIDASVLAFTSSAEALIMADLIRAQIRTDEDVGNKVRVGGLGISGPEIQDSRLLYYHIREIKMCVNINHITVHSKNSKNGYIENIKVTY